MTDTNHQPDANDSRTGFSQWLKKIKEAFIELLPEPLKSICEKGLLSAFFYLLIVVVVIPPIIVFLTAFGLKQLASIDNSFISAIRTAYLDIIYEGFSIEEVASRSNKRLDYIQLFEYRLDIEKPAQRSKEVGIDIYPGQKIEIEFRNIRIDPPQLNCILPDENIPLVSIFLEDEDDNFKRIKTFKRNDPTFFKVEKDWWDKHKDSFDQGNKIRRLYFKVTDEAKKYGCGIVYIEGNIRVFKDIFLQEKGESK
ncbi:MAG: hypothetical protein WCK96_10830 [Methylococcales bacterium]